jgi:hypothetical protein
MKLRLTAITTAALAALLLLAASAGAASLIGLYRNTMETEAQRKQMAKLFGERCGRGGATTAFRVVVGKATGQCAYRTPVVGRDLEIASVARLLSKTPKPVQHKAYLALELRAGGDGSGYELAVFPLQRKAQLLKLRGDGGVEYMQVERKVEAIKGVNQANQLRLRAFNLTSGPEKGSCTIQAWVGKTLVAEVTDPAAGELSSRASGLSVGAVGNAKGAVASFDNVVVRAPSPY